MGHKLNGQPRHVQSDPTSGPMGSLAVAIPCTAAKKKEGWQPISFLRHSLLRRRKSSAADGDEAGPATTTQSQPCCTACHTPITPTAAGATLNQKRTCTRCARPCCTACSTAKLFAWATFPSLFSASTGASPPSSTEEVDTRESYPPCAHPSCDPNSIPSSDEQCRHAVVCAVCDAQPNIIRCLPRSVWALLWSYSEPSDRQQLLQLCHTTQLGVVLPYPYGRWGWASFFNERTFLSRGAHGSVFSTTLRDTASFQAAETAYEEVGPSCKPKRQPGWWAAQARQPVAVKTIQKSVIYSLRTWHHVEREVEALRRCRHPHVIDLIGVVQGPSEVYIVLPYVEGGDLFDWLVRQQIPSEDDVASIAKQLLTTLHYMHEVCGVVHRDVKPENILLERSQGAHDDDHPQPSGLSVRLADFGYAKLLPLPDRESPVLRPQNLGLPPLSPSSPMSSVAASSSSLRGSPLVGSSHRRRRTVSATPCGTLGFAAPEILAAYNAQKEMDRLHRTSPLTPLSPTVQGPQTSIEALKRMDIFAAGVSLCILLTGCEPFHGSCSAEHLQSVSEGVDFSGPQWSYVSRPAKRLLGQMLSVRASSRPSALECLNSRWLKYHDQEAIEGGFDDGTFALPPPARDDLQRSYRASVGTLKKNDNWMYVQDASGVVKTVPRSAATE